MDQKMIVLKPKFYNPLKRHQCIPKKTEESGKSIFQPPANKVR